MSETDNQESIEQSGTGTPGADEAFCSSCGEVIKKEAEVCPECGVRQNNAGGAGPGGQIKNPGIAAVASFFFTGLGQIYNGQIGKGIGFIILQIINIGLTFVVIGLITFPIVWVYGMYDAYKTAERINNGDITV